MITEDDLNAFLSHYPAMRRLSPRLRELIGREGQWVQLPAERVLFDLGSPCYSSLILTQGTIRVTKPSPEGREILLYRLMPGDSCILTVSCLLGGANYPARGVVESDVTGIALPRTVFNQLLDDSREFREFIFRFFAERIAHLMTLLEDIAFRPLDQRVAAWLLAHRSPIATTHQQLADQVGSVREVISRILKEFEGRGMVKLGRGRIEILDRDGLAAIASRLSD